MVRSENVFLMRYRSMYDDKLTIGKVASLAGTKVSTIRFYQRIGLMAEPPRHNGSFRYYKPQHIDRLRLILRAKELGFKLEEIRQMIDFGRTQCNDVRAMIDCKIREIESEISVLGNVRDHLERLRRNCRAASTDHGCPAVAALESG